MKKAVALIEVMNELLAHELWAIQCYRIYTEACKDQETGFLRSISTLRSLQGMKHAKRLIEEIIFLDGEPQLTSFVPPPGPATTEDMHEILCPVEQKAIEAYQRSIQLAGETGEEGTRDLLESLLEKEQQHLAWLQKNAPGAPAVKRPVPPPAARMEASPYLTPSDPDKKCPSSQTSVSFDEMRRRLRKNLQELEQVVASGYLKYLSPEMSHRIMAIVEEQPRP